MTRPVDHRRIARAQPPVRKTSAGLAGKPLRPPGNAVREI